MSGISICVFGSQARGRTDALSDRDVLFVGEEGGEFDTLVDDWRFRNWNVSTFYHDAFSRLAEVKSLFIQHIKQESIIIRDDERFLNRVLSSYRPANNYRPERNDAARFIDKLPEYRSEYWYDLCLCDIFYVLIRNFAVLHLASKSKFVFDYENLIGEICREFRLSSRDYQTLLNMRSLKHAYRSRIKGCYYKETLISAREVFCKIVSMLGDFPESSIDSGCTTDSYFELRMKELTLVFRQSPEILDKLRSDHPLCETWRRIMSAGGYPRPRPKLQLVN